MFMEENINQDEMTEKKRRVGRKKINKRIIRKTIMMTQEEYDEFQSFYTPIAQRGYLDSENRALRYLIRLGIKKQTFLNDLEGNMSGNDNKNKYDDDVDFPTD